MSPDEWSALVGELDEIEALLRASTLHPHIREFALRQVRLLRAALRQYGIAGIKPVEHALEQAVGAMSRAGGVVAEELNVATDEDKSVLARVSNVITRTAADAEKVDKIYKGSSTCGCAA